MRGRRSKDRDPAGRSDRRACGRGPTASAADTLEALALLDGASWSAQDVAELQEFLGAERRSPQADPDFRERLRAELWWGLMVRRSGGLERLPRA